MPKTVPLRQCIGCREQKPKTELIRVVRSPEGELSIDLRGALGAPEHLDAILAANAEDMTAAKGKISDVMLDRLALTPQRIAATPFPI